LSRLIRIQPPLDNIELERFGHGPSYAGGSHIATATRTPPFVANSAEFHLFSKTETERNDRLRRSTYHVGSSFIPSVESDANTKIELLRLRSDAFWELHRSVTENGEGLVQRMRDYEDSRSRSGVYSAVKEAQMRGRNRASLNMPSRKMLGIDGSDDDSDDDIQIFAGELPETQFFGSPHNKKRTLSLGPMDEDSRNGEVTLSSFAGSERCSSPAATCDSSSSVYPSDDEDPDIVDTPGSNSGQTFSSPPHTSPVPAMSFTPALSHTRSESANSSLASLPLPPALPSSSFSFTSPQSLRPMTLSASRSEKAIAALSLAMANGAGGLNDYEALRAIQAPPVLDDCQVGEMWH
jgi:hypothetical protein